MKKPTKTVTKKSKQVKEKSKHLSTLRKAPIKIKKTYKSHPKLVKLENGDFLELVNIKIIGFVSIPYYVPIKYSPLLIPRP